MPEPVDDAELARLLSLVVGRSQSAFNQLHRAMARRVYAFAMRIVRDAHHAEDVVVDTLYEVWEQPDAFRGGSRVSTWIFGIARFKALTLLRKLRPTESLEEVEIDSLGAVESTGFDSVAALEQESGVRNCMCLLSAVHRECMHLVFFEGCSLSDVARVQDCPENTVKTRLFHARKKIEHCLRRLLGGTLDRAGNAFG